MASKVFIIKSNVMGSGEDELGGMLMENFLVLLNESSEKPSTMILINSGVRLACGGSDVLIQLKKLEEQGVEILACTTCLKYFDLMDKIQVGKPTTMAKSIQSMMAMDVVSI